MTGLLLHPGPVPLPRLEAALQRELPWLRHSVWPTVPDASAVQFALVSRLPAGVLPALPNLRLVGSLHAGVDHLLQPGVLAPGVPITRPAPTDGDVLMNEYVLTQVMAAHRHSTEYALAQAESHWHKIDPVPAAARTVGILGFGAMAAPVAALLRRVGFDVAAWARRARDGADVPVWSGEDGLDRLLARSDIVVNLLPLTPATRDLLDAPFFRRMREGAALINVGRGEHVVEADLLEALAQGRLRSATLDVFRQEPLPPDSPLWRQPRLRITPHACRTVDVDDVVRQFADAVRCVQRGEPSPRCVDRTVGY